MALCEYGCPSLEYVYDMTWAEFRIRQFAFKRKDKREWFKIREVAYASIIGPHLDPKKIPTKERFMALSGKSKVTEKIKERMEQAVIKYKEEKNARSKTTSRNRGRNNEPGKKLS